MRVRQSSSAWHEAGSRAHDNSKCRRSPKRLGVLSFQNQQFVADFEKFDCETSHRDVFSAQDDTRRSTCQALEETRYYIGKDSLDMVLLFIFIKHPDRFCFGIRQ